MVATFLETVRDAVLSARSRVVVNILETSALKLLDEKMGLRAEDANAALARAVEEGLLSLNEWHCYKYYYPPLQAPGAYASEAAYITALVASRIVIPHSEMRGILARYPSARTLGFSHSSRYSYARCDWEDPEVFALLVDPLSVRLVVDVQSRLVSLGCCPLHWASEQPYITSWQTSVAGRNVWRVVFQNDAIDGYLQRNHLLPATRPEGGVHLDNEVNVPSLEDDAFVEATPLQQDDAMEDAALCGGCMETVSLSSGTDDDTLEGPAETVVDHDNAVLQTEASARYDMTMRATASRLFRSHASPVPDDNPDMHQPFKLVASTSPRWGIRAVCRGQLDDRRVAMRWGLDALSQINDERMGADMTHTNSVAEAIGGGAETLRSFLTNMPAYHQWVLHGRLSRLRISTQCMRSLWHRQRIQHDAQSIGRRVRLELWELRYPGWLIMDVVHAVGDTMITMEMEVLLDELVGAAFPELCAVPDAVRADVIIAFGRRERMPQLLAAMALHAPRYAHSGKHTVTPRGIIVPSFMTAAMVTRTSWTSAEWLLLQQRFKVERDAAVRRLVGAPGYHVAEAPW